MSNRGPRLVGLMDRWGWWWTFWGIVSLGSFGAAEMWAIFTGHPEHKLSQNFWELVDSLPYPTVWRIGLLALFVFISIHLTFGPRH